MKDQKVTYINKKLHTRMKVLAATNQMSLTALIEKVLGEYEQKQK